MDWYRQGSDVQSLLPALSTYLGHVNLTSTQRYLTMTRNCCPRPIVDSSTMRDAMNDKRVLAPWIRRFLLEYLPRERNLARNTQKSYRDALRLLVIFAATKAHKAVDDLLITDVDAVLTAFLRHIEEKRKCSVSSRNQRLAALHALAGFVAERCPEYLEWCAHLRAIRAKRSAPVPVCYLEKPEIDALLNAPSSATGIGHRDRVLLLFLYNTGARADEAANGASKI
jgi:site-specific recombinase XerD